MTPPPSPGFPPVTRTAHKEFCEAERWALVTDARGRAVAHHVTYEFAHPDGRVLRTRISRPVKPQPYGPSMAGHILRAQLEVDVEEFWACVNDGVLPQRGRPEQPRETIPVGLLRVLRDDLHLDDDRLKTLTREQAITLVNEHWSQPDKG